MAPNVDGTAQAKQVAAKGDSVFERLDTAHFSWFHVKAILISGVGFFTDAYDLYMVGVITPMIAFARWPDYNKGGKYGSLPDDYDLVVKGMALVGTLVGQLLFGMLGDKFGRKGAYGWTLIIMIVCTGLSAGASWGPQPVFIGLFVLWRFLLGVGIGGDYPLSAVITSEYTPQHIRGAMIAAVFSMQGVGYIVAAGVAAAVLAGFKDRIEADCMPGVACHWLDITWRICVACGAVPAILTWYLRTRLPETPRYTVHVAQDLIKAEEDMSNVLENSNEFMKREKVIVKSGLTWADFSAFLSQRKWALILFGTSSTWFLLDVAYYCNNLYTPEILKAMNWAPSVSADPAKHQTGTDIFNSVYMQAVGSCYVIMIGLLPGYIFTIALVEKMGRRTIQFMGFTMMTILLAVIAGAWTPLRANAVWGLVAIYALTFFFANFGPNTTTFIIPGEAFPTYVRSTCHGISAASGKAGAILGVYAFGYCKNTNGFPPTFAALAVFMFAGLLCTFFVPETKGLTLEELGEEEPVKPDPVNKA